MVKINKTKTYSSHRRESDPYKKPNDEDSGAASFSQKMGYYLKNLSKSLILKPMDYSDPKVNVFLFIMHHIIYFTFFTLLNAFLVSLLNKSFSINYTVLLYTLLMLLGYTVVTGLVYSYILDKDNSPSFLVLGYLFMFSITYLPFFGLVAGLLKFSGVLPGDFLGDLMLSLWGFVFISIAHTYFFRSLGCFYVPESSSDSFMITIWYTLLTILLSSCYSVFVVGKLILTSDRL